MKTSTIAAAVSLLGAAVLVGCESTERIVVHEPSVPGIRLGTVDPAIIGTWVLDNGVMLPDFMAGLEVTAFEFAEDGHGHIWFHDLYTGANDRARVFCIYDGETMVLDLSAEPDLIFTAPERTMSFPVVTIDEDNLLIADENNEIALLSRQASLPPDIALGTLPIVQTVTGLPPSQVFGDLVFWGGDLVYNSSRGQLERFDLVTQSLVAPVAVPVEGQGGWIQTTQAIGATDYFWGHCGCGGSPDIFRHNLTTIFDTIETDNDLNNLITIRAAEWMPSTNRLWLRGQRASDGYSVFLIVDSNSEPDQLVEYKYFLRDVSGLAFDGTSFWGIVTMASITICRIDPVTARVVESFEVPDETVRWTGIEFDDNGMLYLVGTDANGDGVLVSSSSTVAVRGTQEPLARLAPRP